jgi:hypothetical protein
MLKSLRLGYVLILVILVLVTATFLLYQPESSRPRILQSPEHQAAKEQPGPPVNTANGTNETRIKALIASCQLKKPNHAYLTITYGNWANAEFVWNWVRAFNRCVSPEFKNKFLVISLDSQIYDDLRAKNIPTLLLRDLVPSQPSDQLAGGAVFGTAQFNSITKNKFWIVHMLLEKYHANVIFSDADVAFVNSKMFDYIDHVMYQVRSESPHNHDMAFASDSSDHYHSSYYGTGFFVALASNFSITLCKRVAEANLAQDNLAKKIFDADVLNNLAGPLRTNRIHVLPFMFFANGYVGDNKLGLLMGAQPWLYHANYLVGQDAKKNYLRRHNAWFES